MSDTTNTRLRMYEQWLEDGQHPEGQFLEGIPMSIKQEYREYYKEKQNDRMETRRPTERPRD